MTPQERTDYIRATTDLTARDYSARVARASDRLPIAATVDAAPQPPDRYRKPTQVALVV